MRKFIGLLFIFLCLHSLSSQEIDITTLSEKDIIKLIDKTIEEKDSIIIEYLSSLGSDFPNYSKFEDYILKKAKTIMESDDLSFPLQLVEAVLYNNLENKEAQDLYVLMINNKINIEERALLEEEKAQIKREELQTLTQDIEAEFSDEERKDKIINMNLELLSIINGYTDDYNKKHYTSNSYLYPIVNKFYQSEVYDGFHSREPTINSFPGFGFEFGIGVAYSFLTLRMDITGSLTYSDLLNNNIKQITCSSNTSLGFTKLNFPINIRSGFIYDSYLYDNMENSDVALTSIPSPTLGLGITGFQFLKILKLDYSTDLLLASFYTENLELALFNRLYLTVNLIRFGIYNLELRGGLDYIYYSEGGLTEYSLTPRFGIGISSYE